MKRNYQKLLNQYYKEENKERQKSIEEKLYRKYGTNKYCLKCGSQLLVSDLKEYKFLCLECDENFYSIEVIN